MIDTNNEDRIAGLEERLGEIDATVADLKKLFGGWLDQTAANAKPLVDTQQMFIQSRVGQEAHAPRPDQVRCPMSKKKRPPTMLDTKPPPLAGDPSPDRYACTARGLRSLNEQRALVKACIQQQWAHALSPTAMAAMPPGSVSLH
jgi:hypothetical protein